MTAQVDMKTIRDEEILPDFPNGCIMLAQLHLRGRP